jgi:hypothetical protein
MPLDDSLIHSVGGQRHTCCCWVTFDLLICVRLKVTAELRTPMTFLTYFSSIPIRQ